MKGQKLAIFGLGFLLLAGMFSPLAAGENDSLHVVMTADDMAYSAGDTVTISLRVYNSGVLTDADNIALHVSTHHNFNNPTNISLENDEPGVYSGTYTVKAADNHNSLFFFYEATQGNDDEAVTDHEDALVIDVYSVEDTVDVSFNGQDTVPAAPGDTLTATILVRTGDSPIPITGFAQLYLLTPDGEMQNYTSYDELDDGIYTVNITMPGTAKSGVYEFAAQTSDFGAMDSAYICVNVLDIWYHRIMATEDSVAFDVCVADLNGAPIDGATVYLMRDDWTQDSDTQTTNDTGAARFEFSDVTGSVGFTGYALAAGKNQTISGAVINSQPEEAHPHEFDILWEGTETVFEPGSEVTIPYAAYDAQETASGQDIYYYITATGVDYMGNGNHVDGPREVLAAGNITTGDLGKFEVTFDAPDTQSAIQVRFEVPIDLDSDTVNGSYDTDDSKYYAVWPENAWNADGFEFYCYEGALDGDGGVSIKDAQFDVGENGTVTISLDAALGDSVMAYWGIGEWTLASAAAEEPEWMRWVPGGQILRLEKTDAGKYEATFVVPEFIADQDVTIASGYMDSATGVPHFDSVTVSPGGGGFPWLWVGIIIIIIVIIIAVIMIAKHKAVI